MITKDVFAKKVMDSLGKKEIPIGVEELLFDHFSYEERADQRDEGITHLPMGEYKVFNVTNKGSCTIAIDGAENGGSYTVVVEAEEGAVERWNWPDNIQWAGGHQPILSTEPDQVDVVFLLNANGKLMGSWTLGHESTKDDVGYVTDPNAWFILPQADGDDGNT